MRPSLSLKSFQANSDYIWIFGQGSSISVQTKLVDSTSILFKLLLLSDAPLR